METGKSLARLQQVIETLLGPDGCPWDKEQTPLTLCDYVIEEAFELVEAIRSGDAEEAREEIGDVLFLLLFIAELYRREGRFAFRDSIEETAAKMIRRHPHVFSDLQVENQEELLRNWENIKRGEKQAEGERKRVFQSLPKGLPPLLRAYRIHSKAARVGFTWPDDASADGQLASEWDEWRDALTSGDAERQQEEFGDYLFMLTEIGRRKGIKANAALDGANRKFLRRFEAMEDMARERGEDLADMDLETMNGLWDRAKKSSE